MSGHSAPVSVVGDQKGVTLYRDHDIESGDFYIRVAFAEPDYPEPLHSEVITVPGRDLVRWRRGEPPVATINFDALRVHVRLQAGLEANRTNVVFVDFERKE